MRRNHLLASGSWLPGTLVFIGLTMPFSAYADCRISGPSLAGTVEANGATVVCGTSDGGSDTDELIGIKGADMDDLTVTVLRNGVLDVSDGTGFGTLFGKGVSGAIALHSGTVINQGFISARGSAHNANYVGAVVLYDQGIIANAPGGAVIAATQGTGAGFGLFGYRAASLWNAGTVSVIASHSMGIGYGMVSLHTGTIANSGSVAVASEGTYGTAVGAFVSDRSSFANNAGTVQASTAGRYGLAAGVSSGGSTITNNATISAQGLGLSIGTLMRNGSTLANNGLISGIGFGGSGVGAGVAALDHNTIRNTGTITGISGGSANAYGMLASGGTIDNAAGGTISARALSGSAYGLLLYQGAEETSLVNRGTISARTSSGPGWAIEAFGAGTRQIVVDNYGQLTGNVLLGNGDDQLILRRSSHVLAQSGSPRLDGGAGRNSLTLEEGVADGASYRNWQIIDIGAGASAELTATGISRLDLRGNLRLLPGTSFDGRTSLVALSGANAHLDAGNNATYIQTLFLEDGTSWNGSIDNGWRLTYGKIGVTGGGIDETLAARFGGNSQDIFSSHALLKASDGSSGGGIATIKTRLPLIEVAVNGGVLAFDQAGGLDAPKSGLLLLAGGALDLGAASSLQIFMTDHAASHTLVFQGGGFVVDEGQTLRLDMTLLDRDEPTGLAKVAGLDANSPASFIKMGAGTLLVDAPQTYHGATAILGGTVQLGTEGSLEDGFDLTLQSGTLDLGGKRMRADHFLLTDGELRNGTLFAAHYTASAGMIGADLDGNHAVLEKTGSGLLSLTGHNDFGGGLHIQDGMVSAEIYSRDTSAGIGAIQNDGALILHAQEDGALAPTISGAGILKKTGAGRVRLAARNFYTGGTEIAQGTLAGSVSGSDSSFGTGAITNKGTLVIDSTDDGTFAQTISGDGDLIKTGTGRLTLTGDNTYRGGSTVTAGTLIADGTNALAGGSVTVSDHAELVIAQGQSVAVSTLTLAPASRLAVTVSHENGHASGLLYRQAQLDGTLAIVTAGGLADYRLGNFYPILIPANPQARIAGQFHAVTTASPFVHFSPVLSQQSGGGDQLHLLLDSLLGMDLPVPPPPPSPPNAPPPIAEGTPHISGATLPSAPVLVPLSQNFLSVARTPNQAEIARIIDDLALFSGHDSDTRDTINQLLDMNGEEARKALAQIGENWGARTAGLTVAGVQSFTNVVHAAVRPQADAQARAFLAPEHPVPALSAFPSSAPDTKAGPGGHAWTRGFGELSSISARQDEPASAAQTAGFAVGLDRHISERVLLGASLGYADTHSTTRDRSQRAAITSYTAALYSQIEAPFGVVLWGYAGYGLHDSETRRHIAFGSVDRIAHGTARDYSALAGVTLGLPLSLSGAPEETRATSTTITLTPALDLAYLHQFRPQSSEHGAGSLDLIREAGDADYLRFNPSLAIATHIPADSWNIDSSLSLGYGYDALTSTETVSARLAAAGSGSFRQLGPELPRHRGLIGATLTISPPAVSLWGAEPSFALSYDGEYSARALSHTIGAALTLHW